MIDEVIKDMAGAPLIVRGRSGVDTAVIAGALQAIPFPSKEKERSLRGFSRCFGYLPRHLNYKGAEFCRESALAKTHPAPNKVLTNLAKTASDLMEEGSPEQARKQRLIVDSISEYSLPGGLFSSGITTKNHNLRIHLDRGNAPGCWSALFVFRKDCGGGRLVFPSLGIDFAMADGDYVLFDGRLLPHGVTPLAREPSGYRFSVVYYVLAGLWDCVPIEEMKL